MTLSKSKPAQALVSRRGLLMSGTALLASVATGLCPGLMVGTAADAATQERFMRLSGLLIDHDLNPAVGHRIAEAAAMQYPDLASMLEGIIAIAEKRQAAAVEDFFADIPAGALKDLAHWVIFAWYSGCSSEKRDAKVFAYEEALTFKTTSDIVTIPSFGFSGPNRWTRPNLPLSAPMPSF